MHDYNRVIGTLHATERLLFHDRLRALDRRVTPGITKLAWTSDRGTLEFYFREVTSGSWGHQALHHLSMPTRGANKRGASVTAYRRFRPPCVSADMWQLGCRL